MNEFLVPRTVQTKRFEEHVAGSRPKNSDWFEFVGLPHRDQSWSLRIDFEAKMASLYDGTCPRDLLQGLVTGTSPLVCIDLKSGRVDDRLE